MAANGLNVLKLNIASNSKLENLTLRLKCVKSYKRIFDIKELTTLIFSNKYIKDKTYKFIPVYRSLR